MKRILVEELKPGMRFSKPVYIDGNNILVGTNVPVQESDIKRLMKWGIAEIQTEGEPIAFAETPVAQQDEKQFSEILDNYNKLISLKDPLLEVHSRAVNEVTKIHTAIRNNRYFNLKDLIKCAEDMYNLIKINRSVFLFIPRDQSNKDPMAVHSVNAALYAMVIGFALKYNRGKIKDLAIGLYLINAGMAQIPLYILNKEGNLTERELTQMQTHPTLGYQALKNLGTVSEEIAVISLQHHEQFNGGGYPKKLKGIDISEFARIASVADNYEALLEKKSYRPRYFYYTALKQLVATGARKFDPVILRIFISVLSVYPIGSLVELNDKRIGVVIGTMKDNPMRPVIKLIRDADNKRIKDVEIVNLVKTHDLYITQTIDENTADIKLNEIF